MCVSRVLRKRIDEDLDEKCIIQPGRDIPKEQYVRRRGYTKQHKSVWEAAIAKYKHVKCIFQNCHFLALSVEDMISHFGYCNGDGSFAKFTCPYCEGRVTSEKILEIHIRRSHEYEHFGIINSHFLDIGEDATGSDQSNSKQCFNSENDIRIYGRNRLADVKVEATECEYGGGIVSQSSLTTGKEMSDPDCEDVNRNEVELDYGHQMEVEESILPYEQSTDVTKPTNSQERSYRGDHIYSKKSGKVSNEGSSNSLLVMKNNLKHYSGPRIVPDKIINCKVEERPTEGITSEDSSIVDKETDSCKKSDAEGDDSGKLRTIKFAFSPAQSTRRKVHQSYTNSWNQSIKTNGFARCLVATCNFISLDIFHIQNHFKTCTGVPSDGPNLCTICHSWLPSAIELSIHSERCKTYQNLMDPTRVPGGNDSERDIFEADREKDTEDRKDQLGVEEPEKSVTTQVSDGKDNKNDGATETNSKKEKSSALRISDIIKLKDNGNMDINHIIQPGPVLPKDQYLRRRAYTKQHKAVWEAALEKHKYVKCIFQNCHFVAMSLEDMIYHFGYCIGDGSFAKFECPHCGGRLTTKLVLDIHIKMSHPEMAANEQEDVSNEMDEEYGSNSDDVLPSMEELKKLVNSREIKTYGRQSTCSKMTKTKDAESVVKCEPYEWCEGSEEPLSCVTVLLEENQTSSVSGFEMVTVEPDMGSCVEDSEPIATGDGDRVCCGVESEHETFSDNTKSDSELHPVETDSEQKVRSSEISEKLETLLVDHGGRSREVSAEEPEISRTRVSQNVSSKRVVDRGKKRKGSPEEGEDPGTNQSEAHQERPAKEAEKTSARKGKSNSESGGGETRGRDETGGGGRKSSARDRSSRIRQRDDDSSDRSRDEESEGKEAQSENRRKLKRKAEELDGDGESSAEASPKNLRVEPVEDEGGTKPLRRRGRPPKKSKQKTGKVEASIADKSISDNPKPGKPGRKRDNEEETSQDEEISDETEVKCAKCDFRAKRKRFSDHNIKKHVGLSWIEGETPLDLTNEKVISTCVRQAFKNRKSATCEICNCVKRSALGFVTHVQNCGKSDEEKEALKVTCPYCPSRVLKYSLPVHLKLSHSDPPKDGKTPEECEVLTKRKSAIKAANKFQEVLEHSDDDENRKSSALYVMYEKGVSKFPKLPHKIRGLWKKMIKEEKKIPCRRGSCLVESTTAQDARRHHFMCPELPKKSYVCQLCDFYSATEDKIQQHVNIHPKTDGDFTVGSEEEKMGAEEDEVEADDYEEKLEEAIDAEVAAEYIKNKSRLPENSIEALEALYKMKFFVRERLMTGRKTRYCRQSLRMTLTSELEEVKDVKLPLSQLHTNMADWVGVSLNTAYNHLPSLEESMSFRVTRCDKTNGGTWKKLGRFEGEILEDTPIIFTGGSVLAMSWCKYSCVRSFKENPREYLAVSSSKDMRKFQDIHDVPVNWSGCIQIWDCGVLKPTLEIPKMMVCIIHDSGQVWDLSWFPVDTFEENVSEGGATRIGLLGAACQDGTIRIWSICDPQKLKSKFRLPLYRTEPKVILQLEGNETIGCLKLAVGKTGVVVGGFANGLVAIWNLKAISSPFCKKVDKTFVLKPYLSFQAHKTSITALSMCPTNSRYIATSGLDRFLRLWDLECVASPIESTVREVCLDNSWPLHWPLTISTFEDVIRGTGRGMVKAIRDAYCEKHRAPLTIDNTCWSLSVNDWLNIICICNNRGEVKVRYMRNMFTADEKFRLRNGHPFSTTTLRLLHEVDSDSGADEVKVNTKKKPKKESTIARTYEEARRYFGLNFKEFVVEEDSKKKSEAKTIKDIQSMEEYPITSVNKVCWNSNYDSFLYLAIGHQSGFVRIRQLEDSKCEDEVRRFFRESKANISKH